MPRSRDFAEDDSQYRFQTLGRRELGITRSEVTSLWYFVAEVMLKNEEVGGVKY